MTLEEYRALRSQKVVERPVMARVYVTDSNGWERQIAEIEDGALRLDLGNSEPTEIYLGVIKEGVLKLDRSTASTWMTTFPK